MLKTAYKHDKFLLNTDVDLDIAGPVVHNSLTIGHLGWLFGLQTSFDTAKSMLTRNNFAVGYQAPDFTLHTNVNDGTEVGGSIYQRVNPQTELGVSLSWSSVNNQTRFALASKYQLDQYATVQAKVNNLSQIGLSYSQQLRAGLFLFSSDFLILSKVIHNYGFLFYLFQQQQQQNKRFIKSSLKLHCKKYKIKYKYFKNFVCIII